MEMEYFVPPAEAEQWYRYWVEQRVDWYLRFGIRESHLRVRPHEPEELSHYSSGDERHRVPLPDRLVGARGHRATAATSTSRAHTEASGTKLEWVDSASGERYTSRT